MGKIKTQIVNISMPLNMSADELAIELSERQATARQRGLMLDIRVFGEPSKKTKIDLPVVAKTDAELAADVYAAAYQIAQGWSPWQRYILGADQGMIADAYDLAVAANVDPQLRYILGADEEMFAEKAPQAIEIDLVELGRAPIELELDDPLTAPEPSITRLDSDAILTNGDVAREIAAGYENITLRDYFELDEHIQNDIRTAWRFSSTLKQIEKLVDDGILAKDSDLIQKLEASAWERFSD